MTSQTPRRIALVSPYDLAMPGGVTEHIRHLALHLQRAGIEPTIIAPCSAEVAIDMPVVSLGSVTSIRINGSVARPTLSPVVMDNVNGVLLHGHFDAVHIHEPLAPMLPLSILNASASANIGTFHAAGTKSLGYASTRRLLRWLAQRLSVRIAVSEAAATFVQHYVPGEYTIIPNGFDAARFHPEVAPFEQWMDGRPNVLFVGRFDEPRKGLDVLLRAWHHVLAGCPAARLLVVGRGDSDALHCRIAELGLPNVEVLGPASAEELPRWYRSAAVFCAPSTGQESFGIVLLEAMGSGIPIVASDIAGYRDVVHHRREGLLVPPGHPAALAATLLHVIGRPTMRAALAKAGAAAATQYAWPVVTERVIHLYEVAIWRHKGLGHGLSSQFDVSAPVPVLHAGTTLASMAVTGVPSEVQRSVQQPQGATPMLTEPFEERVRAFTQRVVGRVLGRSGVSPNILTAIGLLITLLVTLTLARGYLRWGGVLVLLSSFFDMLDGALARATHQKSAFGAFLDSTVDRVAEALIFFGLLLFYQGQPGAQWHASLVYLSIIGSLLVSYTRARAEALGFDCKVGLLGRPERIILLAFGLIVGWLPFALAILAFFTNVTACQRVIHVYQQERKQHPRPTAPKTPRRSWFVSRDQQQS
ncbi:MAG: hypothetical protein NVS2B7_24090 [Herpetosiphon sp.]